MTQSAKPGLTVNFNETLLAGAPLSLLPYNLTQRWSGMSILVNSTPSVARSGSWVAVNFDLTPPSSISVDLTPLGGATPQAIKYAWGQTGGTPNDQGDVWCCAPGNNPGLCLPSQCPIYAKMATAPFGGLSANPFLALITAQGKCSCPPPQICDA